MPNPTTHSIIPAHSAASVIARVKLGLEDPQEKFFTMPDYVRAYNDALDELSEQSEINESSVWVHRRKWAMYTDLRGIVAPTFLRVTAVWNPTSSRWLDPTSVRELDATIGRDWERQTTITRWWFMRGLWFLGTHPVAGDDVSPLRVHYTSLLPHVKIDGGLSTGLSSYVNLPPDYDDVIEYYMMYTLLAERKEADKALDFYKRFLEAVPALKELGDSRMRKDRTPKMGARR
jgi:hypothetical protein